MRGTEDKGPCHSDWAGNVQAQPAATSPPLAPVLRGEGARVTGWCLLPLTPGPSPPKRGRGEIGRPALYTPALFSYTVRPCRGSGRSAFRRRPCPRDAQGGGVVRPALLSAS